MTIISSTVASAVALPLQHISRPGPLDRKSLHPTAVHTADSEVERDFQSTDFMSLLLFKEGKINREQENQEVLLEDLNLSDLKLANIPIDRPEQEYDAQMSSFEQFSRRFIFITQGFSWRWK
jgi:hypothetical protein